jgi:hypothetical protein
MILRIYLNTLRGAVDPYVECVRAHRPVCWL